VSILGHLQRGGSPTAEDRIIASRLGLAAVKTLIESKSNHMVGLIKDEIVLTPMQKVVENNNIINEDLYKLNEIISR
jgi:6-phosphofructokinase 1